VDICPVGALTQTDFRFKQRTWFLKETKSLCTGCATGCNTVVWSREGVVYRQTPRDNDAVNAAWMCDYGREKYKFINDPKRLTSPLRRDRASGATTEIGWNDAIAAVAEMISAIQKSGGEIAGIGSARATTEELFLFKQIAGENTDSIPRSGEGDSYLLNKDLNPNANGAALTGVAAEQIGGNVSKIADGIRSGKIRGLIVLGENVAKTGIGEELLKQLEVLIVISILPNETTALADFVLPGVTFAEKRGTLVNAKWRIQKFNPAIPSVGNARPEWQILALLLRALDPLKVFQTLDEVFAALAASQPALAGLTLSKIGDAGVQLDASLVRKEVAATV
jgi:NADH-quinone oxidoreductase subunit G